MPTQIQDRLLVEAADPAAAEALALADRPGYLVVAIEPGPAGPLPAWVVYLVLED